jgi:hypothetical protein
MIDDAWFCFQANSEVISLPRRTIPRGKGVDFDLIGAAKFFKSAADHDNVDPQFKYGLSPTVAGRTDLTDLANRKSPRRKRLHAVLDAIFVRMDDIDSDRSPMRETGTNPQFPDPFL